MAHSEQKVKRTRRPKSVPVREWFWTFVDIMPGGCWLWTGGRTGVYGLVTFDHVRHMGAHRYAYELIVGPIPKGYHLDHFLMNGPNPRCSTLCVNPCHLEPVSPKEHMLRGNNIVALNARKTHCPHGHEYTQENTEIRLTGSKRCKSCRQREGMERYYRIRGRIAPPDSRLYDPSGPTANWGRKKTHCPQGHEYTEENTYLQPSSKTSSGFCRVCRTCLKERRSKRYV